MNNNDNLHKSKGFTLIELLISVMIIAILVGASMAIIDPIKIRSKARDSQRMADLKILQTALEQYYFKYRAYPTPTTGTFIVIDGANDTVSKALRPYATSNPTNIIDKIPMDPLYVSGAPSSACVTPTSYRYNYVTPGYTVANTAQLYVLTAVLEVENANKDHECHNLNAWSKIVTGPCGTEFDTKTYCYGVENAR